MVNLKKVQRVQMATKLIKDNYYKIEDLTPKDFALLRKAYSLEDGAFVCFGKNYNKLNSLCLIDDENNITLSGKRLVWLLQVKEKKKQQESK